MNCFEFRRLCLSVPDSAEPEFVEHNEQCGDCRRYADGVRLMDTRLRQALDVPMPDELVARLKLRTVIDEERKTRSRGRGLAIAASLVLAAVLGVMGVQYFSLAGRYQELSLATVQHLELHPQHALHHTHGDGDGDAAARLAAMFVDYGAREADPIADVVEVKLCPVMGRQVIHATLATDRGEVAMLYIPDLELPDERDGVVEHHNLKLIPMGGGMLVLSGGAPTALPQIKSRVERSVDWGV